MVVTVKLTNVQLRGKIHHFRMVVPKDLQEHFGRTAHTESLNTENALDAQRKADVLTAKYKAEHQRLRAMMKKQPSVAIPKVAKEANKAHFDLSSVEYELNRLGGASICEPENEAGNHRFT